EPSRDGLSETSTSGDRLSTTPQHLVDLFSDLFGVMVVVTDIDGHPLTDVVNPCGFFSALLDVPHITDLCTSEWASLGTHPALTPTWLESRFGFKCARAFLRSDNQLVGMVIAGGVRSATIPDPESLDKLAKELGVEVDRLEQHHADMYDLDEVRQDEVARGLATLATHLSDLRTNSEQRSEQ
ncbi:MAG: hypothetical protein GXP36_09600, partial [Actinobacteria bacterium]|nr:hypothetical protein [Actinomycetota bacterium]